MTQTLSVVDLGNYRRARGLRGQCGPASCLAACVERESFCPHVKIIAGVDLRARSGTELEALIVGACAELEMRGAGDA